jgi:ribonuclease BN (tRNA processing enzyme)
VRLRDLDCTLYVHDVYGGVVDVPGFTVTAARTCHPGHTLGFRVEADGRTLAYLSDHEYMLCAQGFALGPEWTSGYALAVDADVLVHDAQFTPEEYETRVGWGHGTLEDAAAFAAAARARRLVPFHHDPGHDDSLIDKLHHDLPRALLGETVLVPMGEGDTLTV